MSTEPTINRDVGEMRADIRWMREEIQRQRDQSMAQHVQNTKRLDKLEESVRPLPEMAGKIHEIIVSISWKRKIRRVAAGVTAVCSVLWLFLGGMWNAFCAWVIGNFPHGGHG
jgi:hypothetical protein